MRHPRPESPQHPTILVGASAFGREVLALALRGREGGSLASLEVDLSAGGDGERDPVARAVAEARARLGEMLDLGHFVRHAAPSDARGPRCDVLVFADLSEPGVAERIGELASGLAAELREAFSAVLRGGEGSLSVCPLVCAPRRGEPGERDRMGRAVRALERAQDGEGPARRLGARIFVLEDQTDKYLLSRAELVRQFASFVQLLLFSELRDASASLRPLVERDAPGAEGARGGALATFGCATLELDAAALGRLFALTLARQLLAEFREGALPPIEEIAAEASPRIPERARLETLLWQERAASGLEKHLAPPSIHVPEIDPEDSPEVIVEGKFGPLFRGETARRLEAFRDEVERFKMGRLALEIERRGHRTLEEARAALVAYVEETAAASPRGWQRALEVLRDARTRAEGHLAEVKAEVEAPDLAGYPDPPLEAGIRAIEEAAFHRPRPFRMRALGAVLALALCASGALAMAIRVLYGEGGEGGAAPLGLTRAPASARALLLEVLIPAAAGALALGSAVGYRLWKHRRRHHNWVVSARDDLDQALKRYLARDVVGYFYKRLHFARLLWVQRIYGRLTADLGSAIARLEVLRAALASAEARLANDERASAGSLDRGADGGGILLRGMFDAGVAARIYAEEAPSDLPSMARRALEASAPGGLEEARFADPEFLLEAAGRELGHLADLDPFEAGSAEAPGELGRAAEAGARAFLRELALKLSPPLERSTRGALAPAPERRRLLVPPGGRALVERILAEDDLRGRWEVEAISGDPRRLHLLVELRDLSAADLALAGAARAEGGPEGGRGEPRENPRPEARALSGGARGLSSS